LAGLLVSWVMRGRMDGRMVDWLAVG